MSTYLDNYTLNIDHLEDYLLEKMTQWDVPGLSLAILKDGEPVVVKGYGKREVGNELPVDEYTLFPINGGTRLITVSALSLLVAEGRLSWNDRLADVLPWFKTGSELINREATVIDALAWRIGIPHELLASWPSPGLSRRELLDKLQYITKPTGFRTGQGVSSLLFIAAGEIISAISGASWEDFIGDRLFKPLGMTASIAGPQLLQAGDNVTSLHTKIDGKSVAISHPQTSNLGPVKSVYSNAADMARWLQFQLDNGKIEGQALIPESQIHIIRKVHQALSISLPGCATDLGGWGLGVDVLMTHGGLRAYGAGNDIEGSEAYYGFVPELNLGVATMVNARHGIPQGLLPWIIDRYNGAPERDWISESLGNLQQRKAIKKQALDQQRDQLTNRSQPASLSLGSYAGVYQHPYLGSLTIREKGAALTFTLGEIYQGDLVHANHHTFFREPVKPSSCQSLFRGALRFNISIKGQVESLSIDQGEFFKLHH